MAAQSTTLLSFDGDVFCLNATFQNMVLHCEDPHEAPGAKEEIGSTPDGREVRSIVFDKELLLPENREKYLEHLAGKVYFHLFSSDLLSTKPEAQAFLNGILTGTLFSGNVRIIADRKERETESGVLSEREVGIFLEKVAAQSSRLFSFDKGVFYLNTTFGIMRELFMDDYVDVPGAKREIVTTADGGLAIRRVFDEKWLLPENREGYLEQIADRVHNYVLFLHQCSPTPETTAFLAGIKDQTLSPRDFRIVGNRALEGSEVGVLSEDEVGIFLGKLFESVKLPPIHRINGETRDEIVRVDDELTCVKGHKYFRLNYYRMKAYDPAPPAGQLINILQKALLSSEGDREFVELVNSLFGIAARGESFTARREEFYKKIRVVGFPPALAQRDLQEELVKAIITLPVREEDGLDPRDATGGSAVAGMATASSCTYQIDPDLRSRIRRDPTPPTIDTAVGVQEVPKESPLMSPPDDFHAPLGRKPTRPGDLLAMMVHGAASVVFKPFDPTGDEAAHPSVLVPRWGSRKIGSSFFIIGSGEDRTGSPSSSVSIAHRKEEEGGSAAAASHKDPSE